MTAAPSVEPWKWRARFVDEADLDSLGILVGFVISEYADLDTGRHARPGFAAIRRRTRIKDDRTVRDRVHRIEEQGWLLVTHAGSSPKGGRRRAREWSLVIPAGLGTSDGSSRLGTSDATSRDGLGTSGAATGCIPRDRLGAPDGTPPIPSPAHNPPRAHARKPKCSTCGDDGTVQRTVVVDGMGPRTEDIACPEDCPSVPLWAKEVA